MNPTTNNDTEPLLLTMVETAAMLRLPVDTMRHFRINGIGPRGARIGKRVMYRRADVLAYIEQAFAA